MEVAPILNRSQYCFGMQKLASVNVLQLFRQFEDCADAHQMALAALGSTTEPKRPTKAHSQLQSHVENFQAKQAHLADALRGPHPKQPAQLHTIIDAWISVARALTARVCTLCRVIKHFSYSKVSLLATGIHPCSLHYRQAQVDCKLRSSGCISEPPVQDKTVCRVILPDT